MPLFSIVKFIEIRAERRLMRAISLSHVNCLICYTYRSIMLMNTETVTLPTTIVSGTLGKNIWAVVIVMGSGKPLGKTYLVFLTLTKH